MPYTLRIVFSGLCAFVPDKPFDPADPPTEVVALLRNLFKPIVFSNGDVMAVHIPRVEVEPKNYRSTSTRPIDFVQDPGTSQERDVFVCRFEDIKFAPEGVLPSPGTLTVNAVRPVDENNPTPDEKRSLYWLADFRDSAGANARIKTMLLGDIIPDDGPLVSCRVFISSGELQSQQLQDGLWIFDPRLQPKKLTRSIALEFKGLSRDSEIVFREFDQTQETKIAVGPPASSPTEDVVIEIKNAEVDRFLEFPGERVVQEDYDYEAYFDLCTLTGAPLYVPKEATNTVIGLGGCTPTQILRPMS